ncbi:MAG: HCO3- transporter [Bryobacterales bacterium]|nr:HCO3- transporter [Bryobacterales bacterium]
MSPLYRGEPSLEVFRLGSDLSFLWRIDPGDQVAAEEIASWWDAEFGQDPPASQAELRARGVRALTYSDHTREEVVGRTGFLFGGVAANIRRKARVYGSDFGDALSAKALASILFMYFACLAPAVAFGGLLSEFTRGELGAMEMLVSTAICGVVYALTAGQPLVILGSTGPVIVFIALLYDLCARLTQPFLPTLAWVGLWTAVILVSLAATEASSLVRWFTRFTDEIFAGLISLIFVYEAVKDSIGALLDKSVARDTALLSLVLALGTYTLASQFAQMRRSPYLKTSVRNALADFGPALAIVLMAAAAYFMRPVQVATLSLPPQFGTTSGRPWLVDLWAVPVWVRLAAIVPALLVSILLFLDQNITVRLVNNRRNRLRKGFGYHLDLLVVGLLVGVCSLFGLPWMVAATVRSLNHVQSLANIKRDGDRVQVQGVLENRLTGLVIHLLVAGSILLLDQLRQVPMPVLFGLFLYMGISSMRGNQLFERMRLWLTDRNLYPDHYYVREVPDRVITRFTLIQSGLLGLLWVLKASPLGILFPLLIALLVPIRFLLSRYFEERHLVFLDAEEEPEDEQDAAAGP